MTKTKLYSLILLSMLGGFVMTCPSLAFAAKSSNEEVQTNIERWKAANLIKEKSGTVDEEIREKQQEYDKALTAYDTKRKEIQNRCKNKVISEFTAKVDKLLEEEKKQREKLGKEFDEGSYWEAAKTAVSGTMSLISKAADAAWGAITDPKAAIDDFKSRLNDLMQKIIEKTLNKLLDGGFSYRYQAEQIVNMCKEIGAASEVSNKTELQAFYALADDVELKKQSLSEVKDITSSAKDVYKYCFKPDEKGNMECIKFVVDTENDTVKSLEGVTTGCIPLPFKLYEAKSCLFCPLFHTIFQAIQNASTASYNKIGLPLAKLALIGLAIWIAFMVLKNVSALTVQKAPEFLNNLFQASFKVIIVYFMLVNSNIVYNMIIGPLLSSGFEFGTSFLKNNFVSACAVPISMTDSSSTLGGVLPQYIYTNLDCFIRAIQNELAVPQAIGSSLMCVSRNAAKSNLGYLAKVMPDFSMMFQGIIIYIIAWILSIAFGFYLIDATVSLGIFGMLLPFIILSWPFKITHDYFSKGVSIFMNSFFVYVFMGLVTSISIELIGQGLSGGKGGFEAIQKAINGNSVSELQSLLDIGFSGFLILLACCVFGIKLMMQVEQLADKFAGGGLNLGIGAKLGGLAYGAATKGGMAASGLALGTAKGGLSAAVNAPITKSGKSLKDFGKQAVNATKRGAKNAGKTTLRGAGRATRFLASPAINLYNAVRGRRTPSN